MHLASVTCVTYILHFSFHLVFSLQQNAGALMAGALSSVANLAVTTAHQQQPKSISHSGCLNMGETTPSLESKVDDVARYVVILTHLNNQAESNFSNFVPLATITGTCHSWKLKSMPN